MNYSIVAIAILFIPVVRCGHDADLKRNVFVDWYESTGELLGEGAFGHVTTYRHNRTNKEFAVKVTVMAVTII